MSDDDILATNHVGFTVGDLDRAIRLFQEVFGYELISLAPRNPAGIQAITGVPGATIMVAHLTRPGLTKIELMQYGGPDDRTKLGGRPCDTGFAHLSIDVRDLDAVMEAAARFELKPLGKIGHSTAGPNKGARVVYLRDPDGLAIELIQPAWVAAEGATEGSSASPEGR